MAAARRPPILAVPPDDREPLTRAEVDAACEAYTRELFARAGQLAMPGAPAQLGLDGVAYAPELHPPIEDPAPAGSSLSLAPYTEFRHARDLPPTEGNTPSVLPGQLAFDERWGQTTQQLFRWNMKNDDGTETRGRMDVRADVLRAPIECGNSCACHPFSRLAKCLKVRYETNGEVKWSRSDSGAWSPSGMVTCGNVWCPYCGPQQCRDTAGLLAIAFDEWLACRDDAETRPWRDLWMLTLKIPHYLDENPTVVVDRLHGSIETFNRSRKFRKWKQRWKIEAHARVLDVTFGGRNGVHPHFHIALFVDRAGITPEHAWTLEDPTKRDDEWVVDERGVVDCNGVAVSQRGFSSLADEIERWGLYKPLRACSQTVRKKYLQEIKGSLIEIWESAVRASGARMQDDAHFRSNSLDLAPCENAALYFTKWGLENEVGNSAVKDRGVLRLVDAIPVIPGAAWTYKQWLHATKGRALVVGLTDALRRVFPMLDGEDQDVWRERLKKLAKKRLDEQRRRREAELERDGTPVVKVPEVRVVIRAHLYASAVKLGWGNVLAFVDKVASRGRGDEPQWVQCELDDFLWRNLPLTRGPPDG